MKEKRRTEIRNGEGKVEAQDQFITGVQFLLYDPGLLMRREEVGEG